MTDSAVQFRNYLNTTRACARGNRGLFPLAPKLARPSCRSARGADGIEASALEDAKKAVLWASPKSGHRGTYKVPNAIAIPALSHNLL
jgi:hypothetical protein